MFGMLFWIEFLNGRTVIESEPFRGDVGAMKLRAASLFAKNEAQLNVTSVRVRHEGRVVYSLPNVPRVRSAIS